jgi:endonuclease I
MNRYIMIIATAFIGVLQMSGQSVTAVPSSVAFDSSLTTVTDSLPVWVRNNTSMQISITDINIYGTAFAVRDTAFILAPHDSARTWIRFSSIHNLTYTDQVFVETNLTSGTVVVPVSGTKKYAEPLYAPTQGKSGEQLKSALTVIAAKGHTALGYTIARDRMYGNIDNIGGEVECIYTGRKATFNTRSGATANNFNCEHTWPQSKFSEADPMVSDINHLFSSDEAANSKRSNFPFGVVTSASWNVGGSKYGTGYGGQTVFEPRDEHKGDCARAMLYFITRYPNNYGSFWADSPYQEAAFRDWNKRFPPTARSKARNNGVQQYQGNRNPYIDHPEFVERISAFTGTATVATSPKLIGSPEIVCHSKAAVGVQVGWFEIFANVGTAPLKITSAVFSSPFYSLKDSLGDIEPNGYRRIGISYVPTAVTPDSVSTLTLTYSDGAAVKQTIITIKAQSIIASVPGSSRPGTFQLAQNFPNPFNPSTTVTFSLPEGSKRHVTLKVFDVLGKEVSEPVNSEMDAGEHTVNVSLKDMNSGIYFYRLQSGSRTQTRKMLLLK